MEGTTRPHAATSWSWPTTTSASGPSCASLLEDDGYRVVAEADDASEHHRGRPCAHQPDVVVVDLVMEGSDGLSTVRGAARGRPARPVIVISSLFDPAHRDEAVRLGACYLEKVEGVEALEHAIDQAVSVTHRDASGRRGLPPSRGGHRGAASGVRADRARRRLTSIPIRSCRSSGGWRTGRRSRPTSPSAVILATADADGRPSARTVLLRGFDRARLHVLHELREPQGPGPHRQPAGALLFSWVPLLRQVHLRGPVERVPRRGERGLLRAPGPAGASWRRGRRTSRACWPTAPSSRHASPRPSERFEGAGRAVPALLGRLPPGARRDRAVAGPGQPHARPASLRARRARRRRVGGSSASARERQASRQVDGGDEAGDEVLLVGHGLGVGEVAPHRDGARAGARRQLELHAAVRGAGSRGWRGGRRAGRSGSARGRRPPRSRGIAARRWSPTWAARARWPPAEQEASSTCPSRP